MSSERDQADAKRIADNMLKAQQVWYEERQKNNPDSDAYKKAEQDFKDKGGVFDTALAKANDNKDSESIKIFDLAARLHDANLFVYDYKIEVKKLKELVDKPAKIEEIRAQVARVNELYQKAGKEIKAAKNHYNTAELENNREQAVNDAKRYLENYNKAFNAVRNDAQKAGRDLVLATQARIESSHRNKPDSLEYLKAEENFANASVAVMAAQAKAQKYGDVQSLNALDAATKQSQSMIDYDQNQKKGAAVRAPKSPPSAIAGGVKIKQEKEISLQTMVENALNDKATYKVKGDAKGALVWKDTTLQFVANENVTKAEIPLTGNRKATEDFLKIASGLYNSPLSIHSADPKEREFIAKVAGEMVPPVSIKVMDNKAEFNREISKPPASTASTVPPASSPASTVPPAPNPAVPPKVSPRAGRPPLTPPPSGGHGHSIS